MGSAEPRFSPMHKGNYHTSVHPIFPTVFNPILNKEFAYCKSNMNLSPPRNCQNYNTSSKMDLEIITSPRMQEEPKPKASFPNPIVPKSNNACNSSSKKKKKKRRRRRKKNKTNQVKMTTSQPLKEKPAERERKISVAESEDSFVIFFDEEYEHISEPSDDETETTEDFGSSDSIIPRKKVRFANDSKLREIHPMVVWSYAYQAARKGPWEEYARDRDRFKNRVRNTETLIGHIFTAGHRSRIYEQRFSSLM
ncbi:hypothetical protein Zmor_018132 [Zophobas morio]|uniref:Protein DP71L n=2 Tax=Zophobas morio TaxID=2755281 RepID=A0AA38IB10_9CUCU|nr:hypothetical protein Zmor_018132 [Zophobas morio]